MAYGTIKVDTVTFTSEGIDTSVSVSGLVRNPTFSGNITSTSTISGVTIQGGTLVSGATVTGSAGQFTTITGGTVNFTTITGTTAVIISGVFASGTAAAPSISVGTTTNGLYSPGANQLAITTSGTGRLFVAADGKVGIGTSAPSQRLTVGDGTTTGAHFARVHSANSDVVMGQSGGAAFGMGVGQGGIVASDNASYPLAVGTIQNQALLFGTNNIERLRITADGKVGIGTSAPTYTLEVVGTTNATASSLAQYFGINNTGTAASVSNGLFAPAGNTLAFTTAATERLRITTDGKVGIGTSAPGANLHISSSVNTEALIGASSGSSVLTMTAAVGAGGGSNLGFQGPLIFSSVTGSALAGASERARIDSSGRLLVGTSSTFGGGNLEVAGLGAFAYGGNDVFSTAVTLNKTRGANVNTQTIVQSGDELGSLIFKGSDGSAYRTGANIVAFVDGTPGSNDMPGRLVFSTTADGASSPTERARVTSGGYFKASNSGSYDNAAAGYHEFYQSNTDANIIFRSANGSLANEIVYAVADRAANAAYSFFSANSSWGGVTDNEFKLYGDGNGKCDGAWTGGGADYAEYFEWSDSNPDAEDRRGISVVLDGDKIREAQAGEDPIGVISGNPSMVGDAAWNKWSGKYLRDDYGTYVQEDYEVEDEDGNTIIQQRRKLNPTYDPDVKYISREERPEWDCVGLMGKLRIRKGQVTGSRWIKMRDISDSVEEWLVR